MDIDETNLTLSVANIQNTFETEQAIPEKIPTAILNFMQS